MTVESQDTSALMRAYLAIEDLESRLERAERAGSEPIAIVGMGCRLPGGSDPDAFWRSLRDGKCAVREVPSERWSLDAYFDADPAAAGKMYTRSAAFIDRVDEFDPYFFGISPREAAAIDPQHRLLLEVSWEALERAGVAPDRLTSTRTGVFFGLMTADYTRLQIDAGDATWADAYTGIGGDASFASGRLSYLLGLEGPCMTVATACSSSLVALHLACLSLRRRDCDIALAGGANLMLSPDTQVLLCRMRALAPDGRSKTFDASANGYGRGEGAGVVVLKRLSDALADNDDIVAVVRATAVNHDGQSGGLTVPNGLAQQALIQSTLSAAGVAPGDISYVEAHGTGTSLGDPIEIRALASALCEGRSSASPLFVGSVKTNIGHLEAASGVASIIKVALSLKHRQIPPHLHLENPNPHIPWDEIPVRIPTERTPWPEGEKARIAGVSSFGLSGTNAHAILEEAPSMPEREPAKHDHRLMLLSANTESALRALAASYAGRLGGLDEASLSDACFTAGTGRARLPHRLGIAFASRDDLVADLSAFAQGASTTVTTGKAPVQRRPKVTFLFSGQGSQYPGMGRDLYSSWSVFRGALDLCDEILRPHLERPLLSVLFESEEGESVLNQTAYTQPAIFAIGYALSELWRSWGAEPDVVMGHSVGELTAACVAGVMELSDALSLVATRGRLMQALPRGGAMAAVLADHETARAAMRPYSDRLSIAAINGPTETVVSGDEDAIDEMIANLHADGTKTRKLRVSHAFHSARMDPMLDALEEAAQGIGFHRPRIALVSNLRGRPIGPDEPMDAGYLRRHAREPVLFHAGIRHLFDSGHDLFLEIGPHPTLAGAARRFYTGETGSFLPSLRKGQSDVKQMLTSAAELFARGIDIDYRGIDEGRRARPIDLPTYPFERIRCWTSASRASLPRDRADLPFDRVVRSRLVRERIFEADLDVDRVPMLGDHRIFDRCIAPGALHLALALLAARDTLGESAVLLGDIELPAALEIAPGAKVTAQVVVTPEGGEKAAFQVVLAGDGDDDKLHVYAAGAIAKVDESTPIMADDPEAPARCGQEQSADILYEHLAQQSFALGPSMRWLTRARLRDGEAIGRLRRPEACSGDTRSVWTGLIDGCFQLAACASLKHLTGDPMVPVSVRRIVLLRDPAGTTFEGHAVVRAGGESRDWMEGDIRLDNERGEPVLAIEGLRTVRAKGLAGRTADRDLYRIDWRLAPRGEPRRRAGGSWLLLGDQKGTGERLAELLRARGETCFVVRADKAANGSDQALDPTRPEELVRVIENVTASGPLGHVVHLLSLDATSIEDGHALGTVSALCLAQALAARAFSGDLFLVTSGAQPQRFARTPAAIAQAPLWGIGRVIANEHPEIRAVRIDVDGRSDNALRALADELAGGDNEEDVLLHGAERRAARLVRLSNPAADGDLENPQRLVIPERGALSGLAFEPAPRRPPEDGEVEIRVHTAALNFRDVLNVLDMYPGDPGPLGLECAGTVSAIGEGVSGLSIGDPVMVLAPACFGTYVVAPAEFVVKKPARLSFQEAATIPVAFLTAYHAFYGIAKLKAGDKVLIHAASGGVGAAAVKLALRTGAEVFATASPAKWDHVRALGVKHIMSSRDTDFAEEIMRITEGRGVDVVLNSLIGEAIPKSLSVLREGGCFVEIGKREIWNTERLRAVRSDVAYVPFDLVELSHQDKRAVRSMFDSLASALEEGSLAPLPHKSFPMEEAIAAFRYMSQAKHVGKILLVMPGGEPHRAVTLAEAVRADASYLITGGLGALGCLFAKRLVDLGARHVILSARSEPGSEAREAIRQMEARGARITVVRGDVSLRADVDRMVAAASPELPLRGVIHSAGFLDDGVLVQQTPERILRVMAPKVLGAYHLSEATKAAPLDFFALFSSIASLLGSPGQAGYAAGNAFLDGLARELHTNGIPAVSINWGPWAEIGMAAALGEQGEKRWAEIGVRLLSQEEGISLFERALASGIAQVAAVSISWQRYSSGLPRGAGPLLSDLVDSAASDPRTKGARQPLNLDGKSPSDRRAVLVTFVKEHAARVLGIGKSHPLDLTRPLNELGLDSLMAVELRNALGAGAGLALPATLLFDYPSVELLAGHLDTLLSPPPVHSPSPDSEPKDEATDDMLGELEGLSDAEVAAILEEELSRSANSLARLSKTDGE